MRGRTTPEDPSEYLGLIRDAKEKFRAQKAVIEDDSAKVLFVGDIHGDSTTVSLVKRMMGAFDRVVFLGDYVDRGRNDVEVAHGVLSLLLNEPKIILLAGNHDAFNNIRPRDWTVRLRRRFGDACGEIDEAYVDAFKSAPVAYLSPTHSLLALHGFIPNDRSRWDALKWRKARFKSSRELLWNDPVWKDGRHPNARGKGIWAIGPDLIGEFMGRNHLRYIVRSHEPAKNHIRLLAGGKRVVNIGSSIHYGIRCFFTMPESRIIDATKP